MTPHAKALCVALALFAIPAVARAEGCTTSREYILADSLGELPQSPQSYQNLFKMCLETLQLSNVKDAFLLKDGAVGVIPRDGGIAATAGTLAQFCQRYPGGRLRFISRGEQAHDRDVGQIVKLSSTGATPCQDIKRDRF
jgi:hypothetical protein